MRVVAEVADDSVNSMSSARKEPALLHQQNCFALIPNFFIRERRVVRLIPSNAAAPF